MNSVLFVIGRILVLGCTLCVGLGAGVDTSILIEEGRSVMSKVVISENGKYTGGAARPDIAIADFCFTIPQLAIQRTDSVGNRLVDHVGIGSISPVSAVLPPVDFAGSGIELSLAVPFAGKISIAASSDFQSWTEVTNFFLLHAGTVTFRGPLFSSANRFYRAFRDDSLKLNEDALEQTEGVLGISVTAKSSNTASGFPISTGVAAIVTQSNAPINSTSGGNGNGTFAGAQATPSGAPVPVDYTQPRDSNPGPGTVQAPASLSVVNVTATQSLFGAQRYTINLSGGPTGTFMISGSSGTYTYTASGTAGHLRLTYGGPNAGDFDDMNLYFNGVAGSSTASTFTGTQKAGSDQGRLDGTFTYQ